MFKGSEVQGSKVQRFTRSPEADKPLAAARRRRPGSEVDPSFNYPYGINGIGKKREAINPLARRSFSLAG